VTPPESSLWEPEPYAFISAAERVKLGRRRKTAGGEERQTGRSRRYSTEVKSMVTKIDQEQRQGDKTRRSTTPTGVDNHEKENSELLDGAVDEVLESEIDRLVCETSDEVDEMHLALVNGALDEAVEHELCRTLDESINSISLSESTKLLEEVEKAVLVALEEEVNNTIDEASSTIEEVIEKAVEDAVAESIVEVVESTFQSITEMAGIVDSNTVEEVKSISKTFGDDVAKIIKEIPSPVKNATTEIKKCNLDTSDSDADVKLKKPKKKDKRNNSELPKDKTSKRKSNRVSLDDEPSGSWSCTILTPEVLPPVDEKPPETPLLVHSTLQPPNPIVIELPSPRPIKSPTVVDLTGQTEKAELQATQALLEEISLSVFGVRFRCPLCSFVDDAMRGVSEHMSIVHKGGSKVKVKSPKRQEMQVRMKHPRIHRDTLKSAVEYYKSFGGHFFPSETRATVKFWGKEIPKLRDLSSIGKILETPAKSKIGPRSWMIKNKLLPFETPLEEAWTAPGRPGLKRRPKPQDFELPTVDESESLAKIGKEILNNDINGVNLFEEIDLDVQNQLLADVDGLFSNEPTSFEEDITGLETVSVDSDFDIKDDIDMNRTRRRKSEASKKIKPLKIKKKITLTKTPNKAESMWRTVETDILYNSSEKDSAAVIPVLDRLRNGEMADDDDSEIENKIPSTDGSQKIKTTPAKHKDNSRSSRKTRKNSRLQQLNSSSLNSSRSTSREMSESESLESEFRSETPARSETDSVKSLHLRLSSDTEQTDSTAEDTSSTANGKDAESVKKSILSILANAVKIQKKPGDVSPPVTPKPGRKSQRAKPKDASEAYTNGEGQVSSIEVTPRSSLQKTSKQETASDTKKLRDFRKSPRKSFNVEEQDTPRRKYNKGTKGMEIPAELQLPEGSNRSCRSARGKKKQGEGLQQLLTHLLQLLQERDVNEWFSVPINDKIAPGYSDKVKEPMDFTAMENKLDTRVYGTLDQFIYDFNLICTNCLAYHKEDTCYYKAGRKLQHYGRQLLSRRSIKQTLDDTPGAFYGLTPFELGFDPIEELEEGEDDLNTSFHDDSSFSQSPTRTVSHPEGGPDSTDYMLFPELLPDAGVYMTAAERVKCGRRRGQGPQQETHLNAGKRKRDDEENGGEKRLRAEDMTPITGEDALPQNSLFQHDYFGYTKARPEGDPEDLDPVSRAAKEKLRNLQLQRAGGTYVQCCRETCKKWRFLTEFEDPSLVPEYWECSMNRDKKANRCSTREGQQVEENEEYVNVAYTAGSLVWARVKGFPWWPAMVDYCPDSEEYYWIEEEESRVEPAWYHVVFLEKQVSRSWVRRELVEKMTSVQTPPKNLAVRKNSASQRGRMAHASSMATDALSLSLESRLKKYSFAALFKGKWGDYSDISEDEGGAKKEPRTPQKTRASVDTPEKRPGQSGLETFECAKCGEKVVYTKYPVQKHLKKHRLDLKEYVAKFDPDENGEKFVLIREWIDREEFRKAIAEDPWKPNLGEKGSSSDTDRLRMVEEVVVLEQGPRVYLDPAQSEEFHVQSTASQEEKSAYSKPLLSNDSLIAVSVRNLDPANKNGASFCQIVAFISLHFPYYDLHLDTCRQFVKKAYGLKNPDDEEEPAGTFRIRPAVVQRLYADIAPILQKDKAEIEKAMLHPKFLDVMVQRFLEGEQYCHPRQKERLPYGMMQLSLLAFMALKHPASLEQIIIYLLFLFPGFCAQHEAFRARFREEVSCQPEVEKVVRGREERFTIRREAYPAVVKVLRLFTSSRAVFEALKVSIFDEAFINVLFPGLKVIEDEKASLPAKAVNMTTSVGRNNGTVAATSIATTVQPTQAVIKPPIPCDILIYYIMILEERRKNKMTNPSLVTELRTQFGNWNNKDFKFVTDVLTTKVYVQEADGTYQISPHIKSFGTAVLMKFIIENLDQMVAATSCPLNIKSILPRMEEGSAKLQSDFRTQTLDFSKKKCSVWRPPLPESMLMDLAILATADMNDTASLSGAVEWVQEHFPWYNLTCQLPFASIPERVPPGTDPDTRLSLSPTEMATAKLQLQRLALSCRPQLTAIMTRPDVLNCVLEPGTAIPAEDRRYTRPPFPDGVMVGLALLHIGDGFGWASALSILKFVEMHFPYYEGEMSTRFLSNITSWLTTKPLDAEYFKVEKEKSGIMPRYQIRPDRLLTCFAWMAKFVTFDKESEAVNQLFMKLPPLVKEILSLPPPDWRNYYRPVSAPTIRATPLAKMLATSPVRVVTTLTALATTSPSATRPLEAEWSKPPMETHLMIAMALILKDCKQFQEQEYDYAPPEDVQVNQFSLKQKNSLQQVLMYMKEAFPYYEAKENIKDFVINDIQNNKDMVSQFFNLNKNQDNKLEYEFKADVVASVYEEVLGLADWSNTEGQRTWLRNPQHAETAFGGKAPLSESNILALILFLHGDSATSYSLCVEAIINVMINDVGVASHGLSGQRWGEARLRKFLRETILKLEASGDHFHRDLSHPTLHLGLRTEEGRGDELFADLQKSVFDIINKAGTTDTLRQFLGKFMEMPTPT
jgi:hypothetical protein